MKKVISIFIGLGVFCLSLTVLYLSMRAVLGVGGFCAEGGPYEIKTHCPGGTAYLTPLSILFMLGGGALYFFSSVKILNSPKWGCFFWSALFISLGWNFLDFGMHPVQGNELDFSLLTCGIMFVLMGIVPVFIPNFLIQIFNNDSALNLKTILFGKNSQSVTEKKWHESRTLLLFIHFASAAIGIYCGILIFFNS
jgi:hypothetical protein